MKRFYDKLGKQPGYTVSMDDWYTVTKEDLTKSGGGDYFIVVIVPQPAGPPEHTWKLWKFKMTPKDWENEDSTNNVGYNYSSIG